MWFSRSSWTHVHCHIGRIPCFRHRISHVPGCKKKVEGLFIYLLCAFQKQRTFPKHTQCFSKLKGYSGYRGHMLHEVHPNIVKEFNYIFLILDSSYAHRSTFKHVHMYSGVLQWSHNMLEHVHAEVWIWWPFSQIVWR